MGGEMEGRWRGDAGDKGVNGMGLELELEEGEGKRCGVYICGGAGEGEERIHRGCPTSATGARSGLSLRGSYGWS